MTALADSPAITETRSIPLCVDLDGTLIETDTLLESALALIRQRPLRIFALPLWMLRGKAFLKAKLAAESPLDMTLLPVKREFVEFLEEQKRLGRPLVLATASHRRFADEIAAHLKLFGEVLATDDHRNLRGSEKSRALCERFGAGQFDYAANDRSDFAVWKEASGAILVNGSRGIEGRLHRQQIAVHRVFTRNGGGWGAFLRAIRVHQWTKNLLVFVPLLLSHRVAAWERLLEAVLAFAAFSLCASGVYLVNDLLDLESDRRHAKKRFRPLASGRLSITAAAMAAPVLTAAAFAIALFLLGPLFALALAVYWVTTIAYSFWLKRRLLVDVMVLAVLYTIRIIGGGVATSITVSPWTLAFSAFLFLSLALVKRYSELRALRDQGYAPGRAYQASDVSILSSAGLASGYMAILVMALYINSPEVTLLYHKPHWLWPICLLQVYFVTRFWLIAHRGKVEDDPVVFAIKDRVNVLIAAVSSGFVLLAMMSPV